jgi:cellulose synthase/poly-beta-1,6-N-acetylglucosamine synthase-like glycosyltransferase
MQSIKPPLFLEPSDPTNFKYNPMNVTIITVNHDTKEFIDLCIKGVHRFTIGPYKHLIIDNGSKLDVIRMLGDYVKAGWISLIQRYVMKNAAGHAFSLDWILQHEPSELICLLDSDACPIKENWLQIMLDQMSAENADAIGCSHFRDETLLHPSTMLFRYKAYAAVGKPSFRIQGGSPFIDTGMVFCQKMKDAGMKMIP